MKIKFNPKILILVTFIVVLFSYYCLPSIRYSIKYNYVTIACMGIVFLVYFCYINITVQQLIVRLMICLSLCFIIYYIVPYSLGLKNALNELQQMIIFATPMVITSWIISNNQYRAAKLILLTILLSLLVVMFKTHIALSDNPFVCRVLAKGTNLDSYLNGLRRDNVGGLGFAYSMGPLCFVSFYFTKHNKGILRIIAILVTCLSAIFIVRSQFATLFILTFSFSAIMFAKNIRSTTIKLTIIITVIVFSFLLQTICMFIADTLSESFPTLSYRFADLANYFNEGELESSRGDRIVDTLNLFLKGPIIGVVGCRVNPDLNSIILRTHAGNISKLAEIGIVGFGIYMLNFGVAWKYIKKLLKKHDCHVLPFDISVLYLISYGFINTIGQVFELSIMVYTFVPLALYTCRKLDEKKK